MAEVLRPFVHWCVSSRVKSMAQLIFGNSMNDMMTLRDDEDDSNHSDDDDDDEHNGNEENTGRDEADD
jgi:hypothetical protein